ncbi:MAG: EAL domain-containing protein [Gemmatimonadales bacterium]
MGAVLEITSIIAVLGWLAVVLLWWQRRSRSGMGTVSPGDQYLAHLFHSSPEAVVLLDDTDHVLRANVAFTELFGYTEGEAVGRTVNELIVPEHLREEGLALTRAVAVGRDVDVETVRRAKDGRIIDVSIMGRPFTGPRGELVVYGIYRDVSGQRRAARALRELEKAVATTQVGVTVTDLEGTIIYTNPAEAEMHGWTADELIGRDVSVFARAGSRRQMSRNEIKQMRSWRRESVNVTRDGSAFPVALTSDVLFDDDAEPIAVVTTSIDITQRRKAEEQLRESEERYALAARGANDVLWDWNLMSNELYLSPRWRTLLGCSEEAEVGRTPQEWLGRVHKDDLKTVELEIAAHLQGVSPHLETEHRLRRDDLEYIWVLCRGIAVRDESGRATRMAGSMSDITERKIQEERLHHDAFHDGLTGLPNRALFTTLLQRSMGRAQRSEDRRYAVLFLDLDRFKVINDSLGHAFGDQLLVAFARRLEKCLRPGDTVARLGGDEFTILLDDVTDADDATRVAKRVMTELDAPFRLGEHEVFTSTSIGIAFGGPEYAQPEEVIRDADLAMYRAKNSETGKYEVFDKRMHEHAVSLLRLETDLRRAVERGEFCLFYQPIVELKSQRISGLEALVRWRHPERGLLYPPEFVPLAEETGLIVSLGEWVLREACKQVRTWQQRYPSDPPLAVSVNISPRQFQQLDFADTVLGILRETGLEPGSLKLEITEGVLMEHAQQNVEVIGRLSAAGVQVMIDDFGTGYSSLSYLHRFSVDALKIDRSFITALEDTGENLEIVRTIVTLARSLGMAVVAEGVETDKQQRFLSELECEEVQGYLFSRAVDEREVESMLATQG